MNDSTIQWLEGALMDLRSIEKIMDDAYLTLVACFHCQQCVEKSLKAVLEDYDRDVPKTHDLIRLYDLMPEDIHFTMEAEFLQTISDLYIETRYPGEFGMMPNGKPTPDDVKAFYDFVKEVYSRVCEVLDKR